MARLLDSVLTGEAADKAAQAEDETAGRVTAEQVVLFAEDRFRLFRSTDGLPHAVTTVPGAPRIAKEVSGIRGELLHGFREDRAAKSKSGRGVVIKGETMRSAMGALGALPATRPRRPTSGVGP